MIHKMEKNFSPAKKQQNFRNGRRRHERNMLVDKEAMCLAQVGPCMNARLESAMSTAEKVEDTKEWNGEGGPERGYCRQETFV